MLKRLASIVGWTMAGLAGSLAIFAVAAMVAEQAVPVRLPSLHVSTSQWDNVVLAEGTWVMDNDRQASPLQTSEIVCRRSEGLCRGMQADLLFGVLNLHREIYEITRWDASFLAFRTSTDCVEYAYTIDRVNARVIGTRTTKAAPSGTCLALSPGSIYLTLTDGFAVWQRLRGEAWAQVNPFMWAALGVLWFFVGARIWRVIRRPVARLLLAKPEAA